MSAPSAPSHDTVWLDGRQPDLDALRAALDTRTQPEAVPGASSIEKGVPVYDGSRVDEMADDPLAAEGLMAEWNRLLMHGAGVFAVRGAWPSAVIERVNVAFERLLIEVPADTGDHFATPGRNVRVWNAHEKLALADAEAFIDYNAVPTLALASTAWLGPAYQVTAQMNLVRPGGTAQAPHRDYHLGFQTPEAAGRWPASAHRLSAGLTLQGAVAHARMPIESGPTQLLPHSQNWPQGFVSRGHAGLDRLFAEHRVQVALEPGDALFFNPALLHAAGDNRSAEVERLANLLQIGSAFGRMMEVVDRDRLVRAIYPALLARRGAGSLSASALRRVIAAAADGYPFPVNLELDPPREGGPPASLQDRLADALAEGAALSELAARLDAFEALKRSH